RIVEIALCDDNEGATKATSEYRDFIRELLKEVGCRLIEYCVNGVQTKAVEVIIAQPCEGVVTKVPTDFVTAAVVEINRVAPWRGVAMSKVRAEMAPVISGRSEMVVHDIENDGETTRMTGIDQGFEAIRAVIRVMRREE